MLFTGYKHELLTIVNNLSYDSQTVVLHSNSGSGRMKLNDETEPLIQEKKSPSVNTKGDLKGIVSCYVRKTPGIKLWLLFPGFSTVPNMIIITKIFVHIVAKIFVMVSASHLTPQPSYLFSRQFING